MFKEKIIQAQSGKQEDMLWLIEKFKPLLTKYAVILHYEDAFNDLVLFFIELISTIKLDDFDCCCDGSIVKYIEKAVYNEYIAKSKRNNNYTSINIFISEMSDSQKIRMEEQNATYDVYDDFDISWLRDILTENQWDIINLIIEGYSITEIAMQKHISRQSVNQTKLDIIKKIKDNGFYEKLKDTYYT